MEAVQTAQINLTPVGHDPWIPKWLQEAANTLAIPVALVATRVMDVNRDLVVDTSGRLNH